MVAAIDLTYVQPPLPSTATLTARVGVPFAQNLTASLGTGPYSFTATDLPTGFTLSGGGTLSITPVDPGLVTLKLIVTDANGYFSKKNVTFEILRGSSTIESPSVSTTKAFVTKPLEFKAKVPAVGGVQPVGKVEFKSGGILLASAPVGADGSVAVTTSALPVGNYSVRAIFSSGDDRFGGAATENFAVLAISDFPTPTLQSVTAVPLAGGLSRIDGSGFYDVTAVKVADVDVPFTAVSDTQITFTAPANSEAALKDVTVTTERSTASSVSDASRLYYFSPLVVTSVTPQPVSTANGVFTVRGSGFNNLRGTMTIGSGRTGPAASLVVNSDTEITVSVPTARAGLFFFSLGKSQTGQNVAFNVTFAPPPTLSTTTLTDGTLGVAQSQTLAASAGTAPYDFTATGLPAGLTLARNGILSGTPTEAGDFTVAITVTGGDGVAGTYSRALTIARVNAVIGKAEVSPLTTAANQPVTFSASLEPVAGIYPTGDVSFMNGTTVLGTATLQADGTASLVMSTLAVGTYDVGVTYPGDTRFFAATKASVGQLTINTPAIPPAITSISPALGVSTGGTVVTIKGSDFGGATKVTFGGTEIAAANFKSASDTQIVVSAPAGSAGKVNLSVTTPGGTSTDGDADDFTYGDVPVLTAFTVNDLIPYNIRGAAATQIDAATEAAVTGEPTAYAITRASKTGALVTVSAQGMVSYTATPGVRGADSFGLTATNAFGDSAEVEVSVTVADPTLIARLASNSGTFGEPFRQTVALSGGRALYSKLSATGLPPGLTMDASGTISGTPTVSGVFASVVVTATDASVPAFTGTTSAISLTIGKAAQVIAFTAPADQTFVPGGTVGLSASGGVSGLPVIFASTSPTICTTGGSNGTTVTFVRAGTCAITASQAGDENYAAATDATGSFEIGQAVANVIDFEDPGAVTLGDAVRLRATATSGLSVRFTSESPAICSVSPEGLLTLSSAGLCLIAADQPGDATWNAAATVRRAFGITAEDPAVQKDLIADLQRARARNLILMQPDLLALLNPLATPNAVGLTMSSKGGDFDLARLDGPVWFRMAGSYSTDAEGAKDHYVQLSFGSHLRLSPDAIFGIMATVDTIRMSQSTGTAEGRGWLIGPYVVARPNGTALTFEGQAMFGQTLDQITENGWTAQDVQGTRRMINLKASGLIQRPGVDLRPYLRFSAVQQATDAYVTSAGVPVDAVVSDYVQGSIGLDFTALHKAADGSSLNLRGGVGLSLTDNSLYGRSEGISVRLGVTQTLDDIWTFDADFTGSADSAGDARTMGLSLTWAARF